MKVRALLLGVAALTCARVLPAQQAIRVWGHGHRGADYISTLLGAWEDGYRKRHPEARFENALLGDASGLGGLYTGVADLALMDREGSFIEVDAYQQGTGYDPFRIAVARGSVATPRHAPALRLYVHPANPLSKLTLEQVDSIFDADARRGGVRVKTWADLGVQGVWAAKPVQIYMPEIETAPVQFFERAALKGSQKFPCCLKLFPVTGPVPLAAALGRALKADRFGMALSDQPLPGLKEIPIALTGNDPAAMPTPESITDESYALGRTIYLYANRKPKQPVPAAVAGFMAYIVSPEGQAIAEKTGGYLPLSVDAAAKSREALK